MRVIRSILFLYVPFVCLSVVLQSCGKEKESEAAGDQKVKEEHVREAFVLKKGGLSSTLRIPGELTAFQNVDLYAKVSSFVKELYADLGTEVRAGQLLARMEAPELNAQLSGAESRWKSQEAVYLSSKATYDRLLETSKTPGTVSQNELDMALAKQNSDQAQLESAKAAFREIGDNRNYLEIRAPFGGVITARNVSRGAYVGPSGKGSEQPMFTLVEQQKLRLVVSVPEGYVRHLRKQSEVEFTVKSYPGQVFKANVSRLSGALDDRLRSQRAEMDIVNADKRLMPGMVAEVLIRLSENEEMFAVPSKSVLNSPEGLFLIKLVDNRAVWVPVKIGRKGEEKTEITGEIKEGDVILSLANEEIRNHEDVGKVKIIDLPAEVKN